MLFTNYLLATLVAVIPGTLASPWCSTQGEGTCTFTIWGERRFEPVPGGDDWEEREYVDWSHAVISNHHCEDISGDWRPEQGGDLYSQLPLTVKVTRLEQSNNWNDFGFCYGAGCYDGGAHCEERQEAGELYPTNYCKRAFDC